MGAMPLAVDLQAANLALRPHLALPLAVPLQRRRRGGGRQDDRGFALRIEAMASAAEAMRDQGDFSSLAGSSRIREWLAG
jgi:hypothetical protein